MLVGVDEAGRGPLAGAVFAAAVVLDPARPIEGLADSKVLSPKRREVLCAQIKEQALAYAVGTAEVVEIEAINILQASLLAMRRAVLSLPDFIEPSEILIDGNRCPRDLPCAARAIIKGDRSVACISAASIVAKVMRDAYMQVLDAQYPGYGFAQHKGYPTAAHRQALYRLGPTPVHRLSFLSFLRES